MGVQGYRLPGLKHLPLIFLQPCKLCKSCSERRTAQATAAPRPHPPALKPLKPLKRLKPLQPVMGVQACRLPGLKRLPLKTIKALQTVQKLLGTPNRAGNSAAPRPHRLNIPLACFILQPTDTPRPHINGFLWASKPAVC